jgi:hypothetical protein
MNDIDRQILEGAFLFCSRHGTSPTKLLLGQKQRHLLTEFIEASLPKGLIVFEPRPARTEFRGMKVYAMDDESFLSFA